MGNFFKELGDAVTNTISWVGEKLGDTIDWIREDPMEALAVVAIAYGGYTLMAGAANPAAAGAVGEASAMGSGSAAAAGGEAVAAGAAETAAAAGATEAAAAAGEGLLTFSEMQGMTAGELAASDTAMKAAGTTASGTTVNAGTTVVNGASQISAPFWSADNPYAWMMGGQAVSAAGNMWAADQARKDEEKRYNAKSYYGLSNSGSGGGMAAGASQGLLQISNDFNQSRAPDPALRAKPAVIQAKEEGRRS